MTQRPRKRSWRSPVDMAGALAVAATLIVGYFASTAGSGLPWERRYEISVDVADANRLIKAADVRIAGVNVGQVRRVTAIPGAGSAVPRARVQIALDRDVRELPVDSTARVRPSSVLGATYLDLVRGTSSQTIPDGARLDARRAPELVELTDLLGIFNRRTARSFEASVRATSTALAGRGSAINRTIGSVARALPFTATVARTLSDPATRLPRLIDGAAATSAALAHVAPQLADLVDGAGETFAALADDRAALEQTIARAPKAEASLTEAFTAATPVLRRLTALTNRLAPAAEVLPETSAAIDRTLHAGIRPLGGVPALAKRLRSAFAALQRLGELPATAGSLRKLAELADATGELTDVLTPAQVSCNTFSLWGQNLGNVSSGLGTGSGPSFAPAWLTTLGAQGELLQNAKPSPDLNLNPLPHHDEHECESGNEPFVAGRQQINNPPGHQADSLRPSAPPPGVRERARVAGLLDDPMVGR